MKDIVQWTAPSPLWAAAADDRDDPARTAFRQPAILRFASDSFMDDFMATLESDPGKLVEYLAQPETWRGPQQSPTPSARLAGFDLRRERLRLAAERKALGSALPVPAGKQAFTLAKQKRVEKQLKLYQPAHQRFYLVTACCVCRVTGLPDKAIDPGRQERATFVLRRLIDRHPEQVGGTRQYDEYGFVTTPQGNAWKKVAADNAGAPVGLVAGEDQLALFPLNFIETDERRRRLLGGMIPVGKREAYMGAPLSTGGGEAGNGTTKKTARKILFRTQVTEPWKNLITTALDTRTTMSEGTAEAASGDASDRAQAGQDAVRLLKSTREQIQTVSWLILLDLADYLHQYLPDVWTAIKDNTSADTQPEIDLLNALAQTTTPPSLKSAITAPIPAPFNAPSFYQPTAVATDLRDALRKMIAFDGAKPVDQRNLEKVKVSYDRSNPDPLYPPFLFPLADPDAAVAAPQIPTLPGVTLPVDEDDIAEGATLDNIDKLVGYVVKALPADSTAPEPPPPLASMRPFVEREGLFAIRCVFERPNCGPLDPPVVSDASERFQMAGFFDPDAPARPIRIALPIDTSPAGLRKHDKNTAFMISDMLCGQIARAKGMSLADLVLSVLPWPFHKDLSVPDGGPCTKGPGLEFGMICSLSIPIITICALILLIIIVFLLDLIFKWVPFFIMCFPLPKFKSKAA